MITQIGGSVARKLKGEMQTAFTDENIDYTVGLQVVDPFQGYVYENEEYFPEPQAVPFETQFFPDELAAGKWKKQKKWATKRDVKDVTDSVNNLHTKREAIKWRSGLKVTDPLQLYVHVDTEGVSREYLPNKDALPFTTGSAFNADNWSLSNLVTTSNYNSYSTIYLKYTDIQPDGVDHSNKIALLLELLEKSNDFYIVKFESGTYITSNREIPSKIILKGNGSRQTIIKAPENSTYNYVLQSKNFESFATTPTSGGAYCAGIDGISIDGSMDTFSGTASADIGSGLRWFGVGQYINDVQIFNIPGIGLRTEGSHADKSLNLPDAAYTIGVFNEIRINKTGNDGWHFGGCPDQFIDKVEIGNQGFGYSYDKTPNSFIDTTRNVASFRQWATCEIGTMHCYGNWSGFGFIAGTNTKVFKVRTKYDHLITESCRVGTWFRDSSYVQGSILDVHTCSGDFPDADRGYSGKTPTLIFESNRASIHKNVQVFAEMDNSDGVAVHIGGANQNITCSIYRGLVSDNRKGTGVNIVGNDNNLSLDVVGYGSGNDANNQTSCGVRFSDGKDNIVNSSVGGGDIAYIVEPQGSESLLSGVISCKGSIGKAYRGFENINYKLRRAIFLTYKGGNKTSAFSSALDLSDSAVKEIDIAIEELAYIPDVTEVDISLDIQATLGSGTYPSLQFARYVPTGSSKTSLKVQYKTLNNADISPMQCRFAVSVR